jgi:hypothetical protein
MKKLHRPWLKVMRAEGARLGKRRLGTLSFGGNYHGRTMGAAVLAGQRDANPWILDSDGQDEPRTLKSF